MNVFATGIERAAALDRFRAHASPVVAGIAASWCASQI
jgi:hypothetical protein